MSADSYMHGIRLLKTGTGPRAVVTVESAVVGIVGTAPKGRVNTPVLITGDRAAAVEAFSNDWAFTIPSAVDGVFDEAAGYLVIVNVLDPARHKSAHAGAVHTKADGVFTLAHRWVSDVVVKTSDAGLLCEIDRDYTLDAETGVVTPTKAGRLADRSAAWIAYSMLDPAKVTDADIIGGVSASGAYTGAWALVTAQSKLRMTPRILIAPGYTHSRVDGGLAAVSVLKTGATYSRPRVVVTGDGEGASVTPTVRGGEIIDVTVVPGRGYTHATLAVVDQAGAGGAATPILVGGAVVDATVTAAGADYTAPEVIVDGDGTGARLEAVVRDGKLVGLLVVDGGKDYTHAEIRIEEPADGAGAWLAATVGKVRNAVTAELDAIAERIGAIVYKDGPGGSREEAFADRADWGSQRIEIVEGRVLRTHPDTGETAVCWQSPTKAGRRVATDNTDGWWFSDSNKAITGIVGVEKPVDYVYGSSVCEANVHNANQISVIIHDDGYYTWGSRTTSADQQWSLTKRVRTYDILFLSLQRALRWAIDRNITKNFVDAVAETANGYFREYITLGALVGARCYPDTDLNTPAVLEKSRIYFNIAWCDTPQAEEIVLRTYLETDYLATLLK